MRFPKFRWSKALRNLTSDSAPHSNRHWANGLQRLPSNFLPMNININLLSFKAVILHMRMYNSSCFLFFLNTDKPLLQMDSACFYEERLWFSRENHSVRFNNAFLFLFQSILTQQSTTDIFSWWIMAQEHWSEEEKQKFEEIQTNVWSLSLRFCGTQSCTVLAAVQSKTREMGKIRKWNIMCMVEKWKQSF